MKSTLEETLKTLESTGLTLTMQRRSIVGFLHEHPGHWTAEDIYAALRKRYGALSRATVYKTLEILCAAGEVNPICILAEAKHYDTNTGPHHHFVCADCGTILDISMPCPIQASGCLASEGHVVRRSIAVFHGTCRSCVEKAAPPGTPRQS